MSETAVDRAQAGDRAKTGRLAVVLFNLGGPDRPEAVQPFLFNLFNDPAIIGLPGPFRWLLARFISRRRAPTAREIYRHLGGSSPLLANSEAQATALTARLQEDLGPAGPEVRCFLAMRYWHPLAPETAAALKAFGPDRIVLLPLYPQFSTATTGSSLTDWRRAAGAAGIAAPTKAVCCYPLETGFIAALAARIGPLLEAAAAEGPCRLLFSAHGLPKKIVARGDPYQWQIEQTAAGTAALLGQQRIGGETLDWQVCYQSRVGPLEWIGPATEDAIADAAKDGVSVVLCPLAFVSEHSETLVELDIEYAELAEKLGVSAYRRVPTVDCEAAFIAGLAGLVAAALERDAALAPDGGERLCPAGWSQCPLAAA